MRLPALIGVTYHHPTVAILPWKPSNRTVITARVFFRWRMLAFGATVAMFVLRTASTQLHRSLLIRSGRSALALNPSPLLSAAVVHAWPGCTSVRVGRS